MRHELASNTCTALFAAQKVHPTFNVNSRRWRRVALALALSGVLAGCGVPPSLTANAAYSENVKNSYFDNVLRFNNYNQADSAVKFLEYKIVSRGDNNNSDLLKILNDSGGHCDTSGVTCRCVIDRIYIANYCAIGKCSRYREHWNLKISWDSLTQKFKPQIKVAISKPILVDLNY
jgi:hypothetical protein